MVLLGWTHSVIAIRDTPVADYSASAVNIPRGVAYCAVIGVSVFLSFCRSLILNDHSGIVANCAYKSGWFHWLHPSIQNTMQWVTLWNSLLAFLLTAPNMLFSHSWKYTSIQAARSMRLLTIHRPFCLCRVLQPVAVSRITSGAANNIPHAETLPSNGCQRFPHLNKLRDRIHVTRVFRHCCERQGYQVHNESSILIEEFHNEWSLQLPQETPIERTIPSPGALLYPHSVVPSIPSTPVLASCASTYLRYAFTI